MKGFEPPTPSLPWKCSTPELHWLMRPPAANGAGDETRTRDPQLGRLMLYQLSYARLISLSVGLSVSLEISSQTHTQTHTQTPFVGVIGFEPIQTESPDLQSGPALQLRRTPGLYCQNTCCENALSSSSRWRDSNPRPADYKSAALPTELHRLSRDIAKPNPFHRGYLIQNQLQ